MNEKWWRQGDAGNRFDGKPVSIAGAFLIALLSMIAISYYRYSREWTPLQRVYTKTYVCTGLAGTVQAGGWYSVLMVVTRKGPRPALDEEVKSFVAEDGRTTFKLSEAAGKAGGVKLEWLRGSYYNAKLHAFLAHWIYRDQTLTDLVRRPLEGGLGVLVVALLAAISLDAAREKRRHKGRRLKGPEMVSPRTFNRRMRGDGIGFVQERTRLDKVLRRKRWVRIPRRLELGHFLVIGDAGKGKSQLIRQVLSQIEERGETAIVFDPASAADYIPYFYSQSRGDLILNPLDQRMPYWTPGDELCEGVNALTLAASLFPERPEEDPFLVKVSRQIFAYLLGIHPTLQELVRWLSHPDEIDRHVRGTEYASMISSQSPRQRDAALGSLHRVAEALRMLPDAAETKQRWNTVEWTQDRRGWLFLASRPDTRKRLAPLLSLWLDILMLRLMNQGRMSKRPLWLILDELASLQRLPHLHSAITQDHQTNNPIVLCFAGRSELETRYGRGTDAMISQPATKIFIGASEPKAAQWMSELIGVQEIEFIRESTAAAQFPEGRSSPSHNLERVVRPVVAASEIMGLAERRGYVKCGNLVVPLRIPRVDLKPRVSPYMARQSQLALDLPPREMAAPAAASTSPAKGNARPNHPPQGGRQNKEQKAPSKPFPEKRPFFE